jgi:hypothetical protein
MFKKNADVRVRIGTELANYNKAADNAEENRNREKFKGKKREAADCGEDLNTNERCESILRRQEYQGKHIFAEVAGKRGKGTRG